MTGTPFKSTVTCSSVSGAVGVPLNTLWWAR